MSADLAAFLWARLDRDPWHQLRTSPGATRQEIDQIKAGLLAMADGEQHHDVVHGDWTEEER